MIRYLLLPLLFLTLLIIHPMLTYAQGNVITVRSGESIGAAVAAASAGDTILLESGVWSEHLIIRQAGITLAAAPGATPVLDGGYRLPGGTAVRCDPRSGNCFVYSPLLSIQASDVVVDGLTVRHSRGRGIGVSGGAKNVTVRNCVVENVRNAGLHVTDAQFVTLEYCRVHGAANFAPYSRSASVLNWPVIVNVVSATDVIIRHNSIHENWGEGVAAGRNSQRVQIVNNQIYNNYALQIYAHRTQNTLIQGNLVYFTDDPTFYRGNAPSDCIVINAEEEFATALATANVHILNNIVVGCRNNISFWGNEGGGVPTSQVLVAHNTAVAATGAALKIVNGGVLRDVRVQNNLFAQGGEQPLLDAPASLGSGISFGANVWDELPPSSVQGAGDIVAAVPFAPLSQKGVVLAELFIPPPAVADAGLDLAVACDYFGNGRDALPDIGAVELDGVSADDCPPPDFPDSIPPPHIVEHIALNGSPRGDGSGMGATIFVVILLMGFIVKGVTS